MVYLGMFIWSLIAGYIGLYLDSAIFASKVTALTIILPILVVACFIMSGLNQLKESLDRKSEAEKKEEI